MTFDTTSRSDTPARARLAPAEGQGGHELGHALYARYFESIRDYLYEGLGSPSEAEDAAQQVFAYVIEALPSYEDRGEAALQGWLFSIAHSRLIDELRRRARVVVVEPRELDDRRERERTIPDVAERVEGSALDRTLSKLPTRQRQVLTLRYVYDLSIAEIAGVLCITEAAVRQSEFRAMQTLPRHFAHRSGSGRTLRVAMHRYVPRLPVLAARRLALATS